MVYDKAVMGNEQGPSLETAETGKDRIIQDKSQWARENNKK